MLSYIYSYLEQLWCVYTIIIIYLFHNCRGYKGRWYDGRGTTVTVWYLQRAPIGIFRAPLLPLSRTDFFNLGFRIYQEGIPWHTINWHDCSNIFIQLPTSFKLGRKCHLLIGQLQLFYFIGNFSHTWQGLPLTDVTVQIILSSWQCLSDLEGNATCWSISYNYFISLAASITLDRDYH